MFYKKILAFKFISTSQNIKHKSNISTQNYMIYYFCKRDFTLYILFIIKELVNLELTTSSGGLAIQTSNTIIEISKIAIPAIVTILGFIINYFLTTNNIKKEIIKKKSDVFLDSLSDAPLEILEILTDIMKKKTDYDEKLSTLINKIFAYGTEDSIKIISNMQQYLYSSPQSSEVAKSIAYFILLACQLKYDLTGIKIRPDYWCKLKLTDYNTTKENITKFTNEIVNELELNDFLRIP